MPPEFFGTSICPACEGDGKDIHTDTACRFCGGTGEKRPSTTRPEVEPLREALTALVEDINTYGEPRRHADAIRRAEIALNEEQH